MSFVIYRSSAGSGKTRTLAKEYIKLALAGRDDSFRHILAVTFANKATQEMKGRIVEYLADFAAARPNNLVAEIQQELDLSAAQLQARSRAVLSLVLHRYSQFSISTIDAFFQRVIRSFTREAGLLGNFRLEVDNDLVLDEVIAALMDELGPEHPQLTEWVVQFSRNKLSEGSSWNITRDLTGFAKQIFNEDFKQVEREVLATTSDTHQESLKILHAETSRFLQFMKSKADQALRILQEEGLSANDFSYKEAGTAYKYFSEFSAKRYMSTDTSRMRSYLAGSGAWAAKGIHHAHLKAVAESRLLPLLREMAAYDTAHRKNYRTAEVILENYFAFGLLADVTRKLQHYKSENNIMLLSDAPQFLHGVINDSDTPFVYEKVGSWFHHYLIDEFQDTSRSQWVNFLPLLKEAADQNQPNLLVGDVKQSIYRWRGGDLQLLQREVGRQFAKHRVDIRTLDTNFRSAGRLVAFNNRFFAAASPLLSEVVEEALPHEVYADVAQQPFQWKDDGYVRIEFLEKDDRPWEDRVLDQLPLWLERLQDQKVALKDMAILVRKNEEGQRIANFLLRYQHSAQARPGYRYDVVSNESLRLDTAWSINVLIAAFQFLKNPDDKIARAHLAFELAGDASRDLFAKAQQNQLAEFIPEAFILQARFLTKLSLFELTEELIRLFRLGEKPEELAYLQAFQDLVLEFSAREKTDLSSFLEWWEMYKDKKSIQVSGAINAVTILTVHRAKGLQFKFVFVPFCHWRMNHEQRPLLWVRSEESPFNKLGAVAVTYSSRLEDTVFDNAYRAERTKIYLDNLNLLYVAFTRAEWGLLAFAPQPGKSENLPNTSDVMAQVLATEAELHTHFTNGVFEWGQLKRLEEKRESHEALAMELKKYASCDWREKMVIKRQGREFFDPAPSEKRIKINTGILLHQVLARISYQKEWQQKVAEYFFENPVEDETQQAVLERIEALMRHPAVSTWFDKHWDVRTEAPVLLPGGGQQRIDRVMIAKDRTVIVDYKSGEKKKEDVEQVRQYAGALSAMGYTNVQAYLLYLHGNEVVEVVKGSTLTLFA